MREPACREVLEHACRMAGVTNRPRECLLLQVQGYHWRAIAVQLGITGAAARKELSRGWNALARHHWQAVET